MKVKYYKEDDILVLTLSRESYDHAEMQDNFVVHFTKDERPVRIEVLDASRFLEKQAKALPKDVKKRFFSTAAS